jgi:outer membrane protein OmpA-like peptidoglycan-associated protein
MTPPIHTKTLRPIALAVLLIASQVLVVHASTVRYYDAQHVPSPQAVAAILSPPTAGQRMKMRGGRPLDEPAAQVPVDGGRDLNPDAAAGEQALSASAQAAVQQWNQRFASASVPTPRAARAEPPTALAVAVTFANDSAALMPEAAASLDAIADGMRLAGYDRVYVIEGHTSRPGSWAHNMKLSAERAQSVKRYLVQRRGIPAAALRAVGLGPRALLNTRDPAAAENRRVQFRAA